jgi:hypothetical protein
MAGPPGGTESESVYCTNSPISTSLLLALLRNEAPAEAESTGMSIWSAGPGDTVKVSPREPTRNAHGAPGSACNAGSPATEGAE